MKEGIHVLFKDVVLSLRERRSIESVLRLHPKAEIVLNIMPSEKQVEIQKLVDKQFLVFTQAGYNIKYVKVSDRSHLRFSSIEVIARNKFCQI